jgi:hypothetical protein
MWPVPCPTPPLLTTDGTRRPVAHTTRTRTQEAAKDPLEQFCEESPDADECR